MCTIRLQGCTCKSASLHACTLQTCKHLKSPENIQYFTFLCFLFILFAEISIKGRDMKFLKIEKKEPGKYINRFDVYYETADGGIKIYEMISRDKDLSKFEDLANRPAAAVVIIMHSPDGEKVLINREFRMACGDYVYNFPAGLIETGESLEEAAARELFEETGLRIDEIADVIGESFSAVGFSNEKNKCIVGTASGTISREHAEISEEIEPGWYTKEEVRELLRTERFAARTQAYCYLWSRTGDRERTAAHE